MHSWDVLFSWHNPISCPLMLQLIPEDWEFNALGEPCYQVCRCMQGLILGMGIQLGTPLFGTEHLSWCKSQNFHFATTAPLFGTTKHSQHQDFLHATSSFCIVAEFSGFCVKSCKSLGIDTFIGPSCSLFLLGLAASAAICRWRRRWLQNPRRG
jgi:hypothetical protein